MLGRAQDENRPDDTPEAIARRLAIYHEQTEPVVDRYRESGVLRTLHAAGRIDDVSAEIEAALTS
jgi:adenylate kinase